MTPLYLTAGEKKMFDGLSEELKDGWKVENETGKFKDTSEKAGIRLHLLRLEDPTIQAFIEEAKGKKSVDELAQLVLETDLSEVSERELAKLFFAMGPEPLNRIVQAMLSKAKTDDDIQEISAITIIRYTLLSSLKHSSKM